ncbi:MAG: tRNA (adenosine(37)-N6)-threonylcarbamoyltransferase complex dimerization subunit type 1 TsaB [Magnetococcales bacterium]|nr:tRNA (adenosine(37)-N6)-threonylcarbamoyltransferase complex dimerization subunit type 1 TsaB [Magnetococcales bacterium]
MKILSLDSSTYLGGISLLEQGQTVGHLALNHPQGHASAMPLALEQLVNQVDWSYADIDLIVVTIGPGSFTGLRVALGLAKGIALVHGTAVVAVPTLTAIASAPLLTQHCAHIATPYRLVVNDARRGELFAALYQSQSHGVDDFQIKTCWQPWRYTVDQLSQTIMDGCQNMPEMRTMVVVGDGLSQAATMLGQVLDPASLMLPDVHAVDAIALAHYGHRWYQQHGAADVATLEPLYLRRTTAEEP